ncbi:hypothetical protein Tco_0110694 [Tanacetum coccineum]
MKSRVRIEGLKKKKKSHGPSDAMHNPSQLLKVKDFCFKTHEDTLISIDFLTPSQSSRIRRLCKIVVEVPDSSWLTRSITTCSYPTNKHKDIMKAQKKFKKDATSKVFQRMVWSMSVPDVASPHRCKIYKMARDCSLVDDLKRIMNPL